MATGSTRLWLSDFAQNLIKTEGTKTVEEAIFQITQRKLSYIGKLQPPINLEVTASLCDIMMPIQYVKMKQDARLVYRDNKCYIQVNENQRNHRGRERFSVAHEIGHKLLSKAKLNNSIECDNIGKATEDDEEEWLCDYCAKHLLLLTPQFINPVLDKMSFTPFAVQQIKVDFEISFEAAARALVETTREEAAVVYYTQMPKLFGANKLQIVRYYKSDNFPMYLPVGRAISEKSCISKSFVTDHPVNVTEDYVLGEEKYRINIQTIPRNIYVKGKVRKGVIALWSNINKVN